MEFSDSNRLGDIVTDLKRLVKAVLSNNKLASYYISISSLFDFRKMITVYPSTEVLDYVSNILKRMSIKMGVCFTPIIPNSFGTEWVERFVKVVWKSFWTLPTLRRRDMWHCLTIYVIVYTRKKKYKCLTIWHWTWTNGVLYQGRTMQGGGGVRELSNFPSPRLKFSFYKI